MKLVRKIIHVDMDAFYAAVEQRDFPEYRGRPIIVGGSPDSRGVVATCSYEARKFGVRSAMPSGYAHRLCPEAIFVRPRFDVYREISSEIRDVFLEFTDKVEAISLDEAYLDVTGSEVMQGSATLIASEIKRLILQRIGLTSSAGVSYNKFLSKIASDREKPNGLCVILPEQALQVIREMPIGDFHGIGPATEAKMKRLGILNGADLGRQSFEFLVEQFGKAGRHYHLIAQGIDERPVNPDRVRKSWGAETTFDEDLSDVTEMLGHLGKLSARVLSKMSIRQSAGSTITLKVKYENFETVTRSLTIAHTFSSDVDPSEYLSTLLAKTEAGIRKVRLLGVSFSNLDGAGATRRQLDVFRDVELASKPAGSANPES
jgi:DNA polymerase IV